MSGILSSFQLGQKDPPVLKVIQTWGGRPILDIAAQVRIGITKIGKDFFVEFLRDSDDEKKKQLAALQKSRADIGVALTEARERAAEEQSKYDELITQLEGVEKGIKKLLGEAQDLRAKKVTRGNSLQDVLDEVDRLVEGLSAVDAMIQALEVSTSGCDLAKTGIF